MTGEAAGDVVQAVAYPVEEDGGRFSLPSENGFRFATAGAPSYETFKAVIEKRLASISKKPT